MLNGKRLAITTVLGTVAGFLALWWMRAAAMGALPRAEEAAIVLSPMILGFALGLSSWRINWAAHGIVLGIIFSLPQAFDFAWHGGGPRQFWVWLIASAVIGFLIELITTPIFHMKRRMLGAAEPHPTA